MIARPSHDAVGVAVSSGAMSEIHLHPRQTRGLLKILFRTPARSGAKLSIGDTLIVETDKGRWAVDEHGCVTKLA